MNQLVFYSDCVNWPRNDVRSEGGLSDMIDQAVYITRATFLKHVDRDQLADLENQLGYGPWLHIANDYMVSYHRSKLHGQTVYYLRHSAIEYVFVDPKTEERETNNPIGTSTAGVRNESGVGYSFKLKDEQTRKFNHIPFSEEVILNRPTHTLRENPPSTYTLNHVIKRLHKTDGTGDPEWIATLAEQINGFRQWALVSVDPGEIQNYCTDPKTAKDYAERFNELPPVVLIPSIDGESRYEIVDGGHRVLAAEMLGCKVSAYVPVEENPPATDVILSRDYYHATHDGKAGESILEGGLIVPPPGRQGRAYLAPRAGYVYMSPQLYYASIHALGGVFMGHKYPEKYWRGSRHGYIFLVYKGDLVDVEPDEDDIGALATSALEQHKSVAPDWLRRMAYETTRSQAKIKKYRRAASGETAYQALMGKQIIKRLSGDQRRFLMNMAGVNIANRGPVGFDAAWCLDKLRAPEIAADGSNVLEVADRVK